MQKWRAANGATGIGYHPIQSQVASLNKFLENSAKLPQLQKRENLGLHVTNVPEWLGSQHPLRKQ